MSTTRRSEKHACEQLESEYEDLQRQVTHFQVVRQQLIDARNLIDLDLKRFKAIQRYSQKVIHAGNLRDLTRMTTESIIEAFDVECSAVFFHKSGTGELEVFELFDLPGSPEDYLIGPETMESLKLPIDGSATILEGENLSGLWIRAGLRQVIICPFHDPDNRLGGILVGASRKRSVLSMIRSTRAICLRSKSSPTR